jgi:hypothetical protein
VREKERQDMKESLLDNIIHDVLNDKIELVCAAPHADELALVRNGSLEAS